MSAHRFTTLLFNSRCGDNNLADGGVVAAHLTQQVDAPHMDDSTHGNNKVGRNDNNNTNYAPPTLARNFFRWILVILSGDY